jgi:hypothetical protein
VRLLRSHVVFVVFLASAAVASSAPAVGVASARGGFVVDSVRVRDTATLFEGSRVETMTAASQVRLSSGASIWLAPGSRGSSFRNRFVLEQGEGQFESTTKEWLEAQGVTICANGSGAVARVALLASQSIRVHAISGAFAISDRRGVALANVSAGSSVQVDPSAVPVGSETQLTGMILERDGRFFLTDEISHVTVELKGTGLSGLVGKRVQVAGKTVAAKPAEGASQVVEVSSANPARGPKPVKSIVAGSVIATATGVGLGVGLTQDEEKRTTSR